MGAALFQFKFLIPLLSLILTGCALPGVTGSPIAFVLALLVLGFSACRPLVDDDRTDEFILRRLLFITSSTTGTSCTGTLTNIDLSSVDLAGTGAGFKITGENAAHNFGEHVDATGDFNGDGLGDILVGAPDVPTFLGRAYVIYGKRDGAMDLDAADLSSSADGISILTTNVGDELLKYEESLSFLGDINGDGFDDLHVAGAGSSLYGGYYDGNRVVFGNDTPTDIDITTMGAGQGFILNGTFYTGYGTGKAGDINGDGIDDIAYTPGDGNGFQGQAQIIYGKTSGWGTVFTISGMPATDGFTIQANTNRNNQRGRIQGVGDINGDGVGDMVMANPGNATLPEGGAYVIYGKSGTTRGGFTAAPVPATDGYEITGTTGANWGKSVTAGDFNGDGHRDFVLGSPTYNGSNGQLAVITSDVGTLTLGSLTSSQGFTLEGASAERAAYSIALTGDVNGDGLDDLLVGAHLADNGATDSGSVYLILGQSGIPSTGALLADYAGIRIDGPAASARLGFDVSLGDVNGDGCADMVMGAVNASGADEVYVVYGGPAR